MYKDNAQGHNLKNKTSTNNRFNFNTFFVNGLLCFIRDTKFGPLTKRLVAYKRRIFKARYKIYLIVSPWKIALSIVMMIALLSPDVDPDKFFDLTWGFNRSGEG